MNRPLYREIANTIQARANCEASKNTEWFDKHSERLRQLTGLLPSGSGIDSGTHLDLNRSHAEKLVLETSFHHLDEHGFYDGWTFHTVTVTPSFQGINIRISGRNRNMIKDYLYDTFHYALTRDISYEVLLERFPQFAVTSKWENEDGSKSQCYQAWYSNGVRFWNDPGAARKHAVQLMEGEK